MFCFTKDMLLDCTISSLWEGFGLPVLEAMACGTPVLTSVGCGTGEVTGMSPCS